jgi:hypothetical protein
VNRTRIARIDCTDIIGHRVAQHPATAEQLARIVSAHLPQASRLELNLGGVPSFSPVFIRAFWNTLAQTITPQELRERLHLRTASHTLREAFELGLERILRQTVCPRFQPPPAGAVSLPHRL